TRVEAGAASGLTFLASAVLSSYLVYRAGYTVSPSFTLLVAAASAIAMWIALGRCAAGGARDGAVFLCVLVLVCAWLAHLALPELLPLGGGPDIPHHLVLLDSLELHCQLPADPAIRPTPR